MASITRVEHARQSYTCEKCRETINRGDPYLKWAFRYGGKHVRCDKSSCRPRPSDLTNSDKISRLLQAQESIDDFSFPSHDGSNAKTWWEGLRDSAARILESAATLVREVADEYRDGANNAHGGIAEQLEEKADNVESWADALESYQSELESLEFEEVENALQELETNEIYVTDIMSNASSEYPEV